MEGLNLSLRENLCVQTCAPGGELNSMVRVKVRPQPTQSSKCGVLCATGSPGPRVNSDFRAQSPGSHVCRCKGPRLTPGSP